MRTRTPLTTIAALGLLALSAPAAHAAPASIGKVTQNGGSVSVKVTNPNRYKLRGTLSLVSGQQLVARKRTSVRGHRAKIVRLSVPSGAPRSLTLVGRLGRKGRKATVSHRKVVLAGPGRAKQAKGPVKAPSSPAPASNRWMANAGGGLFALTVANGTISVAEPIDMAVICNQTGEYTYNAESRELFDLRDNWAVGNQSESRTLDTRRANVLMDASDHRVTYRLTSSRSGDTITGTLYQSFFTSKYNPFSGGMSYVNCAGSAAFTAHPAP